MKTVKEITIQGTFNSTYQTTITLGELVTSKYIVIVQTNHKGVINEFEQICNTYNEALKQYLEDISEYATHTALMNF